MMIIKSMPVNALKTLLTIIMLGVLAMARAQELPLRNDVRHADYKVATGASEKVAFVLKSTKLGLLTTSVEGYVLQYKVRANVDWKKSSASDLRIEFSVRSLNTDSDSRDEKMWDYCLNSKEHPEMAVRIAGPLTFPQDNKDVPGFIWLRGKEYPITVNLNLKSTADGLTSSGTAQLSFKALEIPDPSIMIAKVDDTIQVSFQVELKK